MAFPLKWRTLFCWTQVAPGKFTPEIYQQIMSTREVECHANELNMLNREWFLRANCEHPPITFGSIAYSNAMYKASHKTDKAVRLVAAAHIGGNFDFEREITRLM